MAKYTDEELKKEYEKQKNSDSFTQSEKYGTGTFDDFKNFLGVLDERTEQAKENQKNLIVKNEQGKNEGKNAGKIKEVLKNPPKTSMDEALKPKDEGGEKKEPETKKEPEKKDPIEDVTKQVNEKAKELADDENLTKKEKWEKLKNFVGGLLAGPAYRAYKDGVLTGGELGYHIINNGLAKMMAMGGATDRARALQDMNPMNDAIGTSIKGKAAAVGQIAESETLSDAGHKTDAKDATAEAIITRIQNYNSQIAELREAKALLSERMNDKAIETFTKRMDAAKGLETYSTNAGGGGGVGVNLPVFSANVQGQGGTSSSKDELARNAYSNAKTFTDKFNSSKDKKEMIDAMKVRIDKSIEMLENQIAIEQKKLSKLQGASDVEN